MSFHTCFVARLTDSQPKSVELICRHDGKRLGSKAKDLPSAQNLAAFCFPLGPQHVSGKEYMAPEVGWSTDAILSGKGFGPYSLVYSETMPAKLPQG